MLRAYALGAAAGVLSLLLGAVLWFMTEPQQQPALVWGGAAYTSKQDFASYLSSRGADYKTWVLRHPGAAPWEPAPARQAVAPTAKRASDPAPTSAAAEAVGAVERWVTRLPLAPLGLILASGCALLLTVRWVRPVGRLRRLRVTLAAAQSRGRYRSGGRSVLSSVGRLALALVRAARRLRPSIPRLAEQPAGGARGGGRPLSKMVRGRNLGTGDLAFGLLALMAAGLFALYVALLLSA